MTMGDIKGEKKAIEFEANGHKEDETAKKKEVERDSWSGKLDFMMSALSFAVGMGNMWRFPYLCYRNGGGAFLVPYLIMMVLTGMPMIFLEFAFGQYGKLGVVSIWKACPLFQGVGWGMFLVSLITCIYYNMLNGWAIFYIVSSFAKDVPWRNCGNDWNTENCGEPSVITAKHNCTLNNGTFYNQSCFTPEMESYDRVRHLANLTGPVVIRSASDEYFNHKMLGITSGITEYGRLHWELVCCLLFLWILIFLCLIKGLKVSGKATYVTAMFPYVILLILFVRGITLEGAREGILYYITPQWERLASPNVWVDAGIQVFFSLSTCWGGLITLASYNSFNNNCLRDAIVVSVGDCLTSIFGGVVVFAFIGYMANIMSVPISEVATQGAGLAFIVYPQAVTTLPVSPLWAILFMLVLVNVGLGTMFALVQTVHATICDVWHIPTSSKKALFVLLAICTFCFIFGLFICTGAGVYNLQLMDNYSATYGLLFFGICLTVGLSWVYGMDRFDRDINQMLGRGAGMYLKICWKFVTPLVLLALLVFTLVDFKRTSYGSYKVPVWAECVGWLITVAEIGAVPLAAAYNIYHAKGSTFRQKFAMACQPAADWDRRNDGTLCVDPKAMIPLKEITSDENLNHSPEPI